MDPDVTLAKPISEGKAQVQKHQAYNMAAGHSVKIFHHWTSAPSGYCWDWINLYRTEPSSGNFILQLILRNPFNSDMHIQRRDVVLFYCYFLYHKKKNNCHSVGEYYTFCPEETRIIECVGLKEAFKDHPLP